MLYPAKTSVSYKQLKKGVVYKQQMDWKRIENWDYEININGEVRNLNGFIMKPFKKDKYFFVGFIKDRVKKQFSIHRLLGKYFIDNPNNYNVIDHIDGNTTNNNINNLRWVSYQQNNWNRVSKGYFKRGKKYVAHIQMKGKHIHLGTYNTEEEAHNVFMKKFIELRGNEYFRNHTVALPSQNPMIVDKNPPYAIEVEQSPLFIISS